jgi:hypothetical protein
MAGITPITKPPGENASAIGLPCNLATQTPKNVASAAKERSISPRRITRVTPAARIPTVETCFSTLRRLYCVKNTGDMKDKTINSSTRAIIIP